MANDIQIISGAGARIAARLCNFQTGANFLLGTHNNWLDQNVAPIIRSQPTSWVDLHAYASRRGNTQLNDQISQQRCDSVKGRIINYANKVNFNIYRAYGDAESGDDPSNNDGYWRAVDIYVFAAPPPPKPKPEPVDDLGKVRRLIHREFIKHSEDGDNVLNPNPSDEEGKQIVKSILEIFFNVVDPESLFGSESNKERRITSVPVDFLVNRVTINQIVTYSQITFGSTMFATTHLDYVWGVPSSSVTIITNYQTIMLGVFKPTVTEVKNITRKDANLSAIAKPPNP